MQITQDCVAVFHYTLTNDAGEVLDSSSGGEPMAYLHGGGQIVSGLEKAMAGRSAGDHFEVKVTPEEGYGLRDPQMVQQVPRSAFRGIDDIKPGMRFQAQGPGGAARPVLVTAVSPEQVTVDGNHPLAGETLHFSIDLTEVRLASAEELQHGHVHGAGGHHH